MGKQKFGTQSSNKNAWVGVREGHHKQTKTKVTEFIIQDKKNRDHAHLGFDKHGKQAFRKDR